MVLDQRTISSRVLAIGPLTPIMDSWPSRQAREWKLGKRPAEARMVKVPVQAAGIRREPPSRSISIVLRDSISGLIRTNITADTKSTTTERNQGRFSTR